MKKRIFTILLAIVMVFSLTANVFAADVPGPVDPGKTVTIKNSDSGHTYEAYQLFTGDLVTKYQELDLTGYTYDDTATPPTYTDSLSGNVLTVEGNNLKDSTGKVVAVKDTNGSAWNELDASGNPIVESQTLTNSRFGQNLDYETAKPFDLDRNGVIDAGETGLKFYQVLNALWNLGLTEKLTDLNTYAEDILAGLGALTDSDGPLLADVVNSYLKGNVYASADTKNTDDEYKITGLADGYYFIKDKDRSLDVQGKDQKAYTDFILQVVGDVDVIAKSDVPDVEKKILETYDPATGELMQVMGKVVDGKVVVVTDPSVEGTVPLYHSRRTNEAGYPLLYYQRNATDTDFVYDAANGNIIRETTTENNYPVLTTVKEFTGLSSETVQNPPVYRNANGDIYTLRVDENTASVGEWVRYEIVGTVPKMEGYTKYYYIMTDSLSAGLTLPTDAFTRTDNHKFVVEVEYADGTRKALTLKNGESGIPVVANEQSVYYIRTDNADGTTTLELVYNDFLQWKNEWIETKNIDGVDTPVNHGKPVKMVVTYDVQVNNKAIIGAPGNDNAVDLEYSRNPNIIPDKDNDQNKPKKNETDITGKTPKKIVRTYVTELVLKKIDAKTGKSLAGAEFLITGTRKIPVISVTEQYILYKDELPAGEPDGKDDTHNEITAAYAVFYLLKDGTYTDVAPLYDTYDPATNTITYGNYHLYDGYTGTVTNGVPNPAFGYDTDTFPSTYTGTAYGTEDKVKAAIAAAGIVPKYYHYVETTISYEMQEIGTYKVADATHPAEYYQKKGPNYATDNTDVIYTKTAPADATEAADYIGFDGTNLSSVVKTHYLEAGRELVVGSDGTLNLGGLGAGDYTITETKAPEGYNLLRDKIYVNIEFTTDDDDSTHTGAEDYFTAKYKIGESGTWTNIPTGGAIAVDLKDPADAVHPLNVNYWLLEIENKQGSELPTTGGIGTTIFYIVGAVLVVIAAVLLVTRRKMAAKQENTGSMN